MFADFWRYIVYSIVQGLHIFNPISFFLNPRRAFRDLVLPVEEQVGEPIAPSEEIHVIISRHVRERACSTLAITIYSFYKGAVRDVFLLYTVKFILDGLAYKIWVDEHQRQPSLRRVLRDVKTQARLPWVCGVLALMTGSVAALCCNPKQYTQPCDCLVDVEGE
eukprot:GHVR01111531.1.p1 GENE.GHVR01111531.1~~GHVR01111531.1.p1  ORF type:complete len:164 (+),score=7.38 GHVR01111531.1:175-666(+)